MVGSIRSLRSARSRASVRSSSAPVSRLNPTTSAARIAASFRVSAMRSLPPQRYHRGASFGGSLEHQECLMLAHRVIPLRGLATPDQQISLTDPDSRSMATSGRGSGVVGYNVQVAVDTEHHLIVTHEVTNVGSDRAQLANMARQAKAVLKTETLEAVADRGYFSSLGILARHWGG